MQGQRYKVADKARKDGGAEEDDDEEEDEEEEEEEEEVRGVEHRNRKSSNLNFDADRFRYSRLTLSNGENRRTEDRKEATSATLGETGETARMTSPDVPGYKTSILLSLYQMRAKWVKMFQFIRFRVDQS